MGRRQVLADSGWYRMNSALRRRLELGHTRREKPGGSLVGHREGHISAAWPADQVPAFRRPSTTPTTMAAAPTACQGCMVSPSVIQATLTEISGVR